MGKGKLTLCLLLLLALPMQLCACSQSRQVENQAYVLVMGLDVTNAGEFEITVLSPKIASGGKEGESSSGGSGGSNYLQMSVRAESYDKAVERLNWAVPRTLNLSQLKMVVLSKKLAEMQNCKSLFERIARTELLFTAAQVVVCENSAKEFLKAMKPIVGTRLSTDITATLDHYVSFGITPNSTLADLYYLTESVYSDPLATYAMLAKTDADSSNQPDAQPVSALSGSMDSITKALDSDIKTRYIGSVVFSDGAFKGILNGEETILTNLLSNSLHVFWYTSGNQCFTLNPIGRVKVNVNVHTDPVEIGIRMRLAVSDQDRYLDVDQLRRNLSGDIRTLIASMQQMGVEPFGFSEVASKHFLTMDDWRAYNWKEKFKSAVIDLKLEFDQPNT